MAGRIERAIISGAEKVGTETYNSTIGRIPHNRKLDRVIDKTEDVLSSVGGHIRSAYEAKKKRDEAKAAAKRYASESERISAAWDKLLKSAVKGYIYNARADETRWFLLNPEELKFSLVANYEDMTTFASSHANLDYKGSSVEPFTITLFTSRLLHMRAKHESYQSSHETMRSYRYFLESLTVPDGSFVQTGYAGAEPPDCYVHFPGVANVKVRIDKVEEGFKSFGPNGDERVVTFDVTMHPVVRRRVWSEEVARFGLLGRGE